MQLENTIKQLMIGKNYDEKLIESTIELLPEIISIFGEEKIVKLFKEYNFVPRDRIGGNSGVTNKIEKRIEFDWACKSKHEALNLLIHEAGHAIGSLETEKNHFLMKGINIGSLS